MGDVEEPGPQVVVRLERSEASIITHVDDGITELLGHAPAAMVGTASTEWIHPDDHVGAMRAWMEMLARPGRPGRWCGRYRTAGGDWQWVESVNVNHLDDPANPRVATTMTLATGDNVSVEEELRRREELISRLSEAMPIGLFQIDAAERVILANDRLRDLLHCDRIGTMADLRSRIGRRDRGRFDRALADVLADAPVGDLELALADGDERYCRLSVRALTDGAGSVTGAIGCLQDITDSRTLRHQLEVRATTDALTGSLNRAAGELALRQAVEAVTPDRGLALAFIDLDDFKQVNDRLGHAAGDQVLVAVADRLRDATRLLDLVARFGGDEFLVICPSVESESAAALVGRRLAEAVHGDVPTTAGAVGLVGSVGVAWTGVRSEGNALVAAADRAMYDAKSSCDRVKVVTVGPAHPLAR